MIRLRLWHKEPEDDKEQARKAKRKTAREIRAQIRITTAKMVLLLRKGPEKQDQEPEHAARG